MKTIDKDKLVENLDRYKKEFYKKPFNYIVIDDFLKESVANDILDEFPQISQDWIDARGLHSQNKWTSPIIERDIAKSFFDDFTSDWFREYLSNLTGIKDILKDENLNGAGYHQTTNGGFLNTHIDFNRIEGNENMDRRLNLLVYFNKNWKEENGGYLELWDMEKNILLGNVAPSFNRCVIFETNEISFHGHPKPVNLKNGGSRKSLSIYYYTKGREDIDYVDTHNTVYKNTESILGSIKIFINGVKHLFRKMKR